MTGRASKIHLYCIFREAFCAIFTRDVSACDRADDAVDIYDGQINLDGLTLLDRGLRLFEDLGEIERTVEEMVLIHLAVGSDFGANVRAIEDFTVVKPFGFPMIDGGAHF